MEFLTHPIPAVIIMLGLLVFFHEFGHFIVGRMCGIAVETFSIGFGPKIVGFNWRGTDWRIGAIPLGGFVKFARSHPSEDVPPHLRGIGFLDASLTRRALAIFAGPFANVVLAIAVYMILGLDGIPHPPAIVGDVMQGSPAEQAGFRYGDRIVEIGGEPVRWWEDLQKQFSSQPGKTMPVVVERDGERLTLTITTATVDGKDLLGRKVSIGRAGVTLARLQPIVTVVPESAAARQGLVTGDRILAVQADGADGADGQQRVEVDSLAAFWEWLGKTVKAGQTTATIEVKEQSEAPSRLVTFDLSPLKVDGQDPRTAGPALAIALGIRDSQLTIAEVAEPAVGQLLRGDRILSFAGTVLRDSFHLIEILQENTVAQVPLEIERNGKRQTISFSLSPMEAQLPEGRKTLYTFRHVKFLGDREAPPVIYERYESLAGAAGFAIAHTMEETANMLEGVRRLFIGEIPLAALGGPILIAKVAGDSAKRGWQTFVDKMALISINLAILNLLPIPVLDGGQLILIGAQAIRRRPLRQSAIENFQKVGIAIVLALIVLAFYNDVSRFWKSMLKSVVGFFQ